TRRLVPDGAWGHALVSQMPVSDPEGPAAARLDTAARCTLDEAQAEGAPMATGWTTADIPDLDGKTILVTGANSGLGYETALALAAGRPQVRLACRDQAKGRAAVAKINAATPQARTTLVPLDLASLGDIRRCAETVRAAHPRLDVLVNNAGVMALPYRRTQDGFEMQFGTNHLGHFALTGLLLDLLRATPGARIVTVSSGFHRL